VVQISLLTEPFLEVIDVDPCGVGKQLRVLGPEVRVEQLQNISLHQTGLRDMPHPKTALEPCREAHQKGFKFRHYVVSRRRERGAKEAD
jgi:hypothetical protein